MAEYIIAGAVLLAVVFFAAGWWARGKYKRIPPNPYVRKKRHYEAIAENWLHPDPGHQIRFYSLEGDKALAICARIVNGHSITFRNTTGEKRLLSRGQFEDLRKELVMHRICKWNRRRSLSPTPDGWRQAENILIRARAARLHITKQEKKGPGWIFGKWVPEEIKNNFR